MKKAPISVGDKSMKRQTANCILLVMLLITSLSGCQLAKVTNSTQVMPQSITTSPEPQSAQSATSTILPVYTFIAAGRNNPFPTVIIDNWIIQITKITWIIWSSPTYKIHGSLFITNNSSIRRTFNATIMAQDYTDKIFYEESGTPYKCEYREYYPSQYFSTGFKFLVSTYSGDVYMIYPDEKSGLLYKLFYLGSPRKTNAAIQYDTDLSLSFDGIQH